MLILIPVTQILTVSVVNIRRVVFIVKTTVFIMKEVETDRGIITEVVIGDEVIPHIIIEILKKKDEAGVNPGIGIENTEDREIDMVRETQGNVMMRAETKRKVAIIEDVPTVQV